MSSKTPNLDLLKMDGVADGNKTFNIETMLNENWDKIDEAVGNMDFDVIDSFTSTDKTLPPSADALRRGLATKENVSTLAQNFAEFADLPDKYPGGVTSFYATTDVGGRWRDALPGATINTFEIFTSNVGSSSMQLIFELYGPGSGDGKSRVWKRVRRGENRWQPVTRLADQNDISGLLSGMEMTGAIARTHGASNVREYINLDAEYIGGVTGAVRIALPIRRTNTELTVVIEGYDHLADTGYWRAEISFYIANSSGMWLYPNAIITGKAPFSSITLAEDGTKAIILLGGVTTKWTSASVSITKVIAGNSNVSVWGSGWGITTVTDISGLTNAVQPTIQKIATQAYADTAIETHTADYIRQPGYAVTAGTGAAYTAALNPAPAALPDGFGITVVPHAANTVTDPTLKIGTLGALPIRRQSGGTFAAGTIKVGAPLSLVKVGNYFLARSTSAVGNATPSSVLAGKTFMSESNPDETNGTIPTLTGARAATSAAQWGNGDLAVYMEQNAYYTGAELRVSVAQLQTADGDLVAGNIRSGVGIFGVTGTLLPEPVIASGKLVLDVYPVGITLNSSAWSNTLNASLPGSGTYRVSFQLSGGDPAYGMGYAQVYKNGQAFGTQRAVRGYTSVTFTEDLYFAAGDTMQLYIRGDDPGRGANAYIGLVKATKV